ncbi:MAG TPA: hypothetical protein DEB39_04875 [Planctomycetaceae bacterium]|nr:hypothetical protein [Planctomycetaceae bacterium]
MSLSPFDKRSVAERHREAFAFLESRTDFERTRPGNYEDFAQKLEGLRRVADRLGNPQRRLRAIHVAGTKGKGSVCEMLGRILRAAGFRVGSFTSPHLHSFNERFCIDGIPCPMEECVEMLLEMRHRFDRWSAEDRILADDVAALSYFDITTLLSFEYFAKHHVDFTVIEVGMGGRFDSTNICEPLASVITSIGFDHMEYLGDTLEKIAFEKAGIIKPKTPVVSGVSQAGPRDVIRRVARRQLDREPVPLLEIGVDFPAVPKVLGNGFRLRMSGEHQLRNAALAATVADLLRKNDVAIPEKAVLTGLAEAHLPLRIELACERPGLILDGAHNRSSAEALLDVLHSRSYPGKRYLIFGAMKGKDVEGILSVLLPYFDHVVFTRCSTNPRAFPPIDLATVAGAVREIGPGVYVQPALDRSSKPTQQTLRKDLPPPRALRENVVDDAREAFTMVWNGARQDDLVCVAGSLYLAAEIRRRYDEMRYTEGS